MIRTERETVERLLNMAMTHSDLVCDNLESQEYDVASSHAQDLKQVLYVLLDYVQHFTDNTDFELKDLAQKLVDNYDRDSLAYEVGQKLNCMANGNRYIG